MKLKNKNSFGFTIIELIVVIAIIAVLAGIVLVSVTRYMANSKDAAIKGNFKTIQTTATLVFLKDSSYGNLSADPTYINAGAAISKVGGQVVQYSSGNEYCASSHLITNVTKYWCTDSTGFVGPVTAPCDNTYKCHNAAIMFCGDSSCNNGETCSSCPGDCGYCYTWHNECSSNDMCEAVFSSGDSNCDQDSDCQ